MRNLPLIFAITASFVLASGCATNPVSGKKQLALMSEQQEIQIGKEADPQIIAAYGLYEDDRLQEFINSKGQEMAAISHRPGLEYEFKILDSPVVNAFAVPGGYVYFTRGIMAHFNNEAEFAGVLGHEIGHIAARHSVSQYSKQVLFQAGLIAGLIVVPEFSQFAEAASQGVGLLFLKFSRDNESQSDKLGVEYSTKVGYDAHQMADFFNTLDRMRDDEAGNIPNFLSTHPDPADRSQRVHQLAEEWQQSVSLDNFEVSRDNYLQVLDGIVYGQDPRQGFVEDGVFYHPELKFRFPVPAGWKTVNSPSQVQIAPQDGQALIIFAFAQQSSVEAAAQATISENNLQVIEQSGTTVNGFPAVYVLADQQNPQNPQAILRILSYFIEDGSNIYKFHGLSMRPNFQTYRNAFTNTMSGYRRLTDGDKLNRQPERIAIRQAPRNGSLRDIFSSLNMSDERHEELAVLNGMQLEDQVSAGALIKVVGQ